MTRIKMFDPDQFTIYELSRMLRMSYARARKLLKNMEAHGLAERIFPPYGEGNWRRRYKFK